MWPDPSCRPTSFSVGTRAAGDAAVLLVLSLTAALGNRLVAPGAADRGGWAGRRVEALVLVVVNDRLELAPGCAMLHGRRMDPERLGHLLEGKHPLAPQAAEPAFEAMRRADPPDDPGGEPRYPPGSYEPCLYDPCLWATGTRSREALCRRFRISPLHSPYNSKKVNHRRRRFKLGEPQLLDT